MPPLPPTDVKPFALALPYNAARTGQQKRPRDAQDDGHAAAPGPSRVKTEHEDAPARQPQAALAAALGHENNAREIAARTLIAAGDISMALPSGGFGRPQVAPQGADLLMGHYVAVAVANAFLDPMQLFYQDDACNLGVAAALGSIDVPDRLRAWVKRVVDLPVVARLDACEAAEPLGGTKTALPSSLRIASDFCLTDAAVTQAFSTHNRDAQAVLSLLNQAHGSPIISVGLARICARAYELGAIAQDDARWRPALTAATWYSHPSMTQALRRLEHAMGHAPHTFMAQPTVPQNLWTPQYTNDSGFPDTTHLVQGERRFFFSDEIAPERIDRISEHLLQKSSSAMPDTLVQRAVETGNPAYVHRLLSQKIKGAAANAKSVTQAVQIAQQCAPLIQLGGGTADVTRWLLAAYCGSQGIDAKIAAGDGLMPLRHLGSSILTHVLPAGVQRVYALIWGGMRLSEVHKSHVRPAFLPERVCKTKGKKSPGKANFAQWLTAILERQQSANPRNRRTAPALAGTSWGPGTTSLAGWLVTLLNRNCRLRGPLPLFAQLPPEAQQAFVADIDAWRHVGCAAVLVPLLISDVDACWQAYAKMPFAKEHTLALQRGYAIAKRLSEMPVEVQSAALHKIACSQRNADYDDFADLELRLRLMAPDRLNLGDVAKACRPYLGYYRIALFDALADRLSLQDLRKSSMLQTDETVLRTYLTALLENREIEVSELTRLTSGADWNGVLKDIDVGTSLHDASSAALRRSRIEHIVRITALRGQRRPIGEAVQTIVRDLHQIDLRRVPRLSQVDAATAALPNVGPAPQPHVPVPRTVHVGGIELNLCPAPGDMAAAIPTAAVADLVLTPTTALNLRRLAALWACNMPALLEGPTSAGKTSLVRYVAHKTGHAYRRISLSFETDVSDLLGRYVGGELALSAADLASKSDDELRALAHQYATSPAGDADALRARLYDAQQNPRWVDGVVVKAMRRGEVLLLDEINLARPDVIERLNSLFDDDANLVLTEHHNEKIVAHPQFRCFATMNPSVYAGRGQMSDASRSRWRNLYCTGLTDDDLQQVLVQRYGQRMPLGEMACLIRFHGHLARAAEAGEIGRALGGVAFTLRHLIRVCERFVTYRYRGLTDAELLVREINEVYLGGLITQSDLDVASGLQRLVMPAGAPGACTPEAYYARLGAPIKTAHSLQIGDFYGRPRGVQSAEVPSGQVDLVTTPRTVQILYRLAKALAQGENVALVGERAGGKTAITRMYAGLIELPYLRQMISTATDTLSLVGGYKERGWSDGLLLQAMRQTGTGGVVLLDEFNLGSPSLLERLNGVLDDERQIVLTEKEGEVLRAHENFQFVAAMNPPSKNYGGRKKLSSAQSNRMTFIHVVPMDRAEEALVAQNVATRAGIDGHVANALCALNRQVADGYAEGRLGVALRPAERPIFSIRELLANVGVMARLQQQMPEADAFRIAADLSYGAGRDADDAAAIRAIAEDIAVNGAGDL